VPLEILLAVGRFDPANMIQQGDNIHIDLPEVSQKLQTAGDMFKTWSFETELPLSLTRLREMVKKELPASIYRCKGIFYTEESPEKRTALQIVGRRTEINELDDWGERSPHTRIVAIGSSKEMDPDSLTALFESCIIEPEGK
jgi:G3E family GTPase